jgi:hypothetical protein
MLCSVNKKPSLLLCKFQIGTEIFETVEVVSHTPPNMKHCSQSLISGVQQLHNKNKHSHMNRM